MFNIEGNKKYTLDLEAVLKYVSTKPESTDAEVTDSYDYDKSEQTFIPTQRLVRQLKTDGVNQEQQVKYDLVKTLLIQAISCPLFREETNELDFGTSLVMETLLEYGFAKEIKK